MSTDPQADLFAGDSPADPQPGDRVRVRLWTREYATGTVETWAKDGTTWVSFDAGPRWLVREEGVKTETTQHRLEHMEVLP